MLLNVKDLKVEYRTAEKISYAVKGASFEMQKGEILGIVGESGSGKTTLGMGLALQLPQIAKFTGKVIFKEKNLVPMTFDELREVKGKEISVVFQEPMTSLNPLQKVGRQVEEIVAIHDKSLSKEVKKDKVLRMFRNVELENPKDVYGKYPHELSGGMQQRVMIAMALMNHPDLLIADEPTTALDAKVQEQILDLLKSINQRYGTSIILISHDLNVIKKICDRALVMYKGEIVEEGSIEQIFNAPEHEYTKSLIANITKGKKEQGNFEGEFALEVKDLTIVHRKKSKRIGQKLIEHRIVENVNFFVKKGEILGLVGSSGSGKSSICRGILGLDKQCTGEVVWHVENPQMIFQDSAGSLNPGRKVSWILEEPLKVKKVPSHERRELVKKMLKKVELDESVLGRYPRELSGGQKQRVNIALALITGSKFIVADEPVSALDVTIQGQIIKLLLNLQKELDLSMLFISHDKAVVEQMCDRIIYMEDFK